MKRRPSRDPRPVIERLVPAAFEGSSHSPVVSTFLRGVTTGALVGAAIAGSALWSRYRRGRATAIKAGTTSHGAGSRAAED